MARKVAPISIYSHGGSKNDAARVAVLEHVHALQGAKGSASRELVQAAADGGSGEPGDDAVELVLEHARRLGYSDLEIAAEPWRAVADASETLRKRVQACELHGV